MTHKIAVIGGTGPQGRGLAYRLAMAGHTVTIGSRDAARAAEKSAEIAAKIGGAATIGGAENSVAAATSDVVLLAVPWDGHAALVTSLASELRGKTVISCVNPLGFDQDGPYGLTLQESAAEEAQRIVPDAAVVGSFHHVAALSLWKNEGPLSHEDILVCGDNPQAKDLVMDLAAAVTGKRGIDAGALRLARQLEPLTAVLININKNYKTRSGLAITGVGGHA
ncbi:NADPH-dependent F420 reductase [Zafaria cholistanensis]|uniref:NADPH-dependent F420 reductase n=1 Tax=Zafaria cholistanensis TaxID=1682741 RepID=A0A5A7NNV2_9MICC|nr:NADPH-dependent F420 reductase [Zafaria cholistanensis]GER22319.1 NADPH-dependent F420 reductase [Zafaria cholistanensis]